mgnify:CR=1 FL=1
MYGRRDGFALLEVLVVVSIIALLASVTLANVSSARARARDTVRISDLKLIGGALDLYRQEHGSYPDPYTSIWNRPGEYNGFTDSAFSLPGGYGIFGSARWPAPGVMPAATTLTSLLAPYIKLPVDPLNRPTTGNTTPLTGAMYGYYYHYHAANDEYDLTAALETPSHPASCGVMRAAGKPYLKKARLVVGESWCPETGYGSSITTDDNIYALQ